MNQNKKLTDIEEQNLTLWRNRHFCGNSEYTLNFSNDSGTGISVEAQCVCGERKDITDYSN